MTNERIEIMSEFHALSIKDLVNKLNNAIYKGYTHAKIHDIPHGYNMKTILSATAPTEVIPNNTTPTETILDNYTTSIEFTKKPPQQSSNAN